MLLLLQQKLAPFPKNLTRKHTSRHSNTKRKREFQLQTLALLLGLLRLDDPIASVLSLAIRVHRPSNPHHNSCASPFIGHHRFAKWVKYPDPEPNFNTRLTFVRRLDQSVSVGQLLVFQYTGGVAQVLSEDDPHPVLRSNQVI